MALWQPGKAWVFDDTIEHEACNDSDQLRAIMVFDLWHRQLTAAERHMTSALSSALNEFTGSSGGVAAAGFTSAAAGWRRRGE